MTEEIPLGPTAETSNKLPTSTKLGTQSLNKMWVIGEQSRYRPWQSGEGMCVPKGQVTCQMQGKAHTSKYRDQCRGTERTLNKIYAPLLPVGDQSSGALQHLLLPAESHLTL